MLKQVLPLHLYMLDDVLGSLVAVLVFPILLYAPGYVAAFATDLFGFRRRAFAERSLWAIACSFCIMPIAAHLVGRIAGLTGLCWFTCSLAVITAFVLARQYAADAWSVRDRQITAVLVCGWTALVLLLLVDVQVGHKLYFSVVMADQSYRIAFTDAVLRTGVPPANPLYFAGAPTSMRYFYFWYILCATGAKLAHISARQAFIGSSVWAGFGLLVTVELYTRHFFRWKRNQRWIAQALLLVTGADLIPALGQAFLQPTLNGDTEWWSVDPIDGWPDSLLWVPHHVASALCCLLAFLLLWRTVEQVSQSQRLWAVVFAAMALASAFGLSVYVAFGFVLLMGAWSLRLAVLRDADRVALWTRMALAGILSALLLAPFLQELVTGSRTTSVTDKAAPHTFSFSVRRMIDSELITGLPVFAPWHNAHPLLLDQVTRLVLLLPGLAMELGLYGVVLVLLLLAKRHPTRVAENKARDTSLFMSLCGLGMTMFLSSAVISNNDFGYRAVMLPQFFLLLLAADVLGSWRLPGQTVLIPATPGTRTLVYSLFSLGACGSLYWAILLRAWLPIETIHHGSGFGTAAEDNYQVREAFDSLHQIAASTAVVSFRPIDPTPDREGAVMVPNEYYQRMLVMDAGRQFLNAEDKCAVHFGGDPRRCPFIQSATKALYATSPAPPSAEQAHDYCQTFGVQYLVLSAWDPGWRSTTGWPVMLPVVAREPRFKILACR